MCQYAIRILVHLAATVSAQFGPWGSIFSPGIACGSSRNLFSLRNVATLVALVQSSNKITKMAGLHLLKWQAFEL